MPKVRCFHVRNLPLHRYYVEELCNKKTQALLFGDKGKKPGEVDLLLTT